MNPSRNHIVWHPSHITRKRREERNGHQGIIVWFTGLPSSGKSTIAHAAESILHERGYRTIVLDGDNIRHGLCVDLGFSMSDRDENIRRSFEVAKLFLEHGTIVFVALVSPIKSARHRIKASIQKEDFIELYCKCPVSICKERDSKDHYSKAEKGEIRDFTGVTADYEVPDCPDLILDTEVDSIDKSVEKLMSALMTKLQRSAESNSNSTPMISSN